MLQDRAQTSVVIAFEALGPSILVSRRRIDEAMDALGSNDKSVTIKKMGISLSLIPRGKS